MKYLITNYNEFSKEYYTKFWQFYIIILSKNHRVNKLNFDFHITKF